MFGHYAVRAIIQNLRWTGGMTFFSNHCGICSKVPKFHCCSTQNTTCIQGRYYLNTSIWSKIIINSVFYRILSTRKNWVQTFLPSRSYLSRIFDEISVLQLIDLVKRKKKNAKEFWLFLLLCQCILLLVNVSKFNESKYASRAKWMG